MPVRDSQAWQVAQAGYALAEGGVFGQGVGASRAKWGWLSAADTDFIFAVLGAETGLIGCLVVIVLFAILGFGLFQVVRLHPNRICQVTTAAVGCWLLGQAIVNIGMVLGITPVIGVPLQFVSMGGSALVASLGAIGAVFGTMRADPDVGPLLKAHPSVARRMLGVVASGVGGR